MPVAHEGEWRPNEQTSKTTKAAAGGEFRKNNIGVFIFIYILFYIYYTSTVRIDATGYFAQAYKTNCN